VAAGCSKKWEGIALMEGVVNPVQPNPSRTVRRVKFPAPSLADVAWKHLVEGCDEVFPGLLRGFAEPPAVKLPTPMPSLPHQIRRPMDHSEDWTIFGDVDGKEPPAFPCCTGIAV